MTEDASNYDNNGGGGSRVSLLDCWMVDILFLRTLNPNSTWKKSYYCYQRRLYYVKFQAISYGGYMRGMK